jgi:hypothetical protein
LLASLVEENKPLTTSDLWSATTRTKDDEATRTTFPDYSDVDFSRYLRPVDDTNPMHRLWSDGRWLKAYLAHGCYWHSCAFCDVTLDYIRSFLPVVDIRGLFLHLKDQAEKTGVRGVHFVDEAAPPSSLVQFALANREAGLPLNFWGNIRFDKAFTPDAAAILAAGGLMGVSAGIEVATEKGLARLGKGLSLADIVRCCAAFKEAGILVHAYLIYGYWDQDEQEIIDSAEIVRQFFSEGLLDSAFWHKFVLTRHSRLYAEKEKGLHPGLKIKDKVQDAEMPPNCFALNDLSFEGEKKFDKYTGPLDRLLAAWLAGDAEAPVEKAFPFKVKAPSVPAGMVRGLLDAYARDRNRERSDLPTSSPEALPGGEGGLSDSSRVVFLGSRPYTADGGFVWRWRLTEHRLKAAGAAGKAVVRLIAEAVPGTGFEAGAFYSRLEAILGKAEAVRAWKVLRKGGLSLHGLPFDVYLSL